MADVLVVGAGPTGLFMAIELIRRGLSVRIIDKNLEPTDKSKAIAIQAKTLELFDHIGIVDRFLAKGLKVHAANVMCGGKRLAHFDLSNIVSPYPFILSLEQSKTEEILHEYLLSLGVCVERGVELLSFEEKENGIAVTLSNGQMTVPWLIGCDGAHSTTRKTLRLTFEGRTFPKTFSLADVQVDWEFPHDEFFLFFNKKGILAAIPLPEPKRYRIIFQSEPTLEGVERLLRQFASPHCTVSKPHWMTEFTINTRMPAKFLKGRVFLAGDAAHIHSPAGGQGMNTGFQDASNLAWKLDLVHRGKANPVLLETYDTERRFVAKKLLKGTELISHMVILQNPLLISLRNWVISTFSSFLKKKLPRIISQTNIHYPPNLSLGPKGGSRVPNLKIGSSDLYSLCRGKAGFFILAKELQAISSEITTFSYDSEMIYAIRPDMYIGCISSDPAVIKSYFANIFNRHIFGDEVYQ